MKIFVFPVLFAAIALATFACTPNLPPKESPEDVVFIDPQQGGHPGDGFRALAEIRLERPVSSHTYVDVITAMRTEAAKLGADALILHGIMRQDPGGMFLEEMWVAAGLAIYYPERHRR